MKTNEVYYISHKMVQFPCGSHDEVVYANLIFKYCSVELDNSATFMSYQKKQKDWMSSCF